MKRCISTLVLFCYFSVFYGNTITDGLFIRTDYITKLANGESKKFEDSIRIFAIDIENGKLSFDFMGGHDFIFLFTKKTGKTT